MASRMHAGERTIEVGLVQRLLRAQHPQWGDRPVTPVASSGTDNALFRLGDDLVVRLPRIGWAVDTVARAHRWLPVLAPRLPLVVSEPVAMGEPGEGYPWPWSVYPWLDGEDAFTGRLDDLDAAARQIAGFLAALQAVDPAGGPAPRHGGRGRPLAAVDDQTRGALAAADGLVDTVAAGAAWERALSAPDRDGPAVWFHGDIARGNLLVHGGRITAVIDAGGIGVGDPACDLAVAWDLFDGRSRAVLRPALAVDDATWARARGWALCTALCALPYYLGTNPAMVAQARHKIAEVLADRCP
jgi:aminoglycoside phosphotransferase (APT) family kinase protein